MRPKDNPRNFPIGFAVPKDVLCLFNDKSEDEGISRSLYIYQLVRWALMERGLWNDVWDE